MLDAARLLPVMRAVRYVDSLWEIKTVMPLSEQDDSRPILLRPSERFPRCFTVLGAKIDSVYDVEAALKVVLEGADGGAGGRMRESLVCRRPPRGRRRQHARGVHRRNGRRAQGCHEALRDHSRRRRCRRHDVGARAGAARPSRLFRFLRLSRHFGEETAIAAGLEVAIGDYVIVMLPNMDPPALIPEFFESRRVGDGHRVRRSAASEERADLVSRRRARCSIGIWMAWSARACRRTRRSSGA